MTIVMPNCQAISRPCDLAKHKNLQTAEGVGYIALLGGLTNCI
jgi:hypothetical protein